MSDYTQLAGLTAGAIDAVELAHAELIDLMTPDEHADGNDAELIDALEDFAAAAKTLRGVRRTVALRALERQMGGAG